MRPMTLAERLYTLRGAGFDEFEKAAGLIVALTEALQQNVEWFRAYAEGHEAKGDSAKAQRNRDRADFNEAAIARANVEMEFDE
jgi:hypothetical protein